MKKTNNAIRFETRVPIREVMAKNPIMIGIEATAAKAARTMCSEEVGSVIILKNTKPIGIVTEEDLACKVVAKDLKPSTIHVSDIMSTPLITVSADKTVVDAARMMVKHKVRRLPVVDETKKVIGIVTVRDLLTVSNELNELLTDLIEINREEIVEQGVCDRCSQMSDDLKRVDSVLLCPSCREEDHIR
ncbi:MAG: CBS domain-containing protein [Methanoregula sp.]|jgi:CBS domain-containing protein|uniref:CBS domain-containing protein n=1 Tax=Methanoregula sp. TaxID=2052170 RepID=UPI0025F4D68D|nr:CBS domain-containing protein [Methanoregula sp.]MCK9631718.1 CBS domain-containing protein [Methanoregula sp.]